MLHLNIKKYYYFIFFFFIFLFNIKYIKINEEFLMLLELIILFCFIIFLIKNIIKQNILSKTIKIYMLYIFNIQLNLLLIQYMLNLIIYLWKFKQKILLLIENEKIFINIFSFQSIIIFFEKVLLWEKAKFAKQIIKFLEWNYKRI